METERSTVAAMVVEVEVLGGAAKVHLREKETLFFGTKTMDGFRLKRE
ncbi:hypothetical protein CCACVL1_27358 [Corchorus capsularis]|uniref:Uncharacterized protein n=1 Tax=Corchorus capsularis TaxID=210143 RepID=A0A1R3GAQ5_COCAP|nr:hypothetical protein CCACVL1_27358 [Corchorus capsularis]